MKSFFQTACGVQCCPKARYCSQLASAWVSCRVLRRNLGSLPSAGLPWSDRVTRWAILAMTPHHIGDELFNHFPQTIHGV